MAATGNRIVHEILAGRGSSNSESMPTRRILTSWKEIAAHVGKSVRTVQRWERELGLPVRRPNPGDRNIVLAFPEELDGWLVRRLTPRANIPVDCLPELERMQKLTAQLRSKTDDPRIEQELNLLRLQQRYLMDTLKAGVMILDNRDIVITHNVPAVSTWALPGMRIEGKRLANTELVFRCPDLPAQLETSKANNNENVSFSCRVRLDGEDRTIQVTLKPMLSETGERDGTVIYTEDITAHERLQNTVEQLEATGEELQSANEELETTNEELQSTNEELETTNEELQSTNEELETTNEELQSLNEELENMNEELERRTHELNDLTARYAETLRGMPWPVLLVDREERIQLWNTAAQRLFGAGATSVVGVSVDQLPISAELRKSVTRKYRAVLAKNKPSILRSEKFVTPRYKGSFDLHFTPIGRDNSQMDGVLVMFSPGDAGPSIKPAAIPPRRPKSNRIPAPKPKTSNGRRK